MQKHWNRMQGYSLSVVVQGEATKQAWWIIIQMFSTGTLNGMRSRLASRKILITHLISHRASSAPGGAPACVCEWVREERKGICCCSLLNNVVYISVSGNTNEEDNERNLSLVQQRSFFSPRVPPPTSHLPPHIVKSRESQACWIARLAVCISFSWYGTGVDFSCVSMYHREALCVC